MPRNKYGAVKKTVDGITFDSTLEADFYIYIKQMPIKILELQPRIYLTKAKILYKPDFLLEDNGHRYYVDVKGMETPVFKIKKRLWKAYIKNELHIVKRSGKRFKTSEIINVKTQ